MPNSLSPQPALYSPPLPSMPLPREALLKLVETALRINEIRYARQVTLAWLNQFPGDLPVTLWYSRALLQEGLTGQAIETLAQLIAIDPEYLEAQEILAQARPSSPIELANEAESCLLALGAQPKTPKSAKPIPKWVPLLRASRKELGRAKENKTQVNRAEQLIHQTLLANAQSPLVGVTHLRVLAHNPAMPPAAIVSLASTYLERWPQCVACMLFLANGFMEIGNHDQAVALLHQAVSLDLTGQVARRLWGNQHPYLPLWPDTLEAQADTTQMTGVNLLTAAPQSIPIPAGVAVTLGWNQLAAHCIGFTGASTRNPNQAEITHPTELAQPAVIPTEVNADSPEGTAQDAMAGFEIVEQTTTSRRTNTAHRPTDIVDELKSLAQKLGQPTLAKLDGRFRVYVLLTTRSGLEARYGTKAFPEIDQALRNLAATIRKRRDWDALLFYADDPGFTGASRSTLHLQPAKAQDPWSIKLALKDLDQALAHSGEMIGALLIVGGPEVVPFHHLPNPMEDNDAEVPSDNPYATRDENYFYPEWPVGRLLGSNLAQPEVLLEELTQLTTRHQAAVQNFFCAASRSTKPNLRQRIQDWFSGIIQHLQSLAFVEKNKLSTTLAEGLGYTAARWRRVSHAVYRNVGDPHSLLVSPPMQVTESCQSDPQQGKKCLSLHPARLGYFNLHGNPESAFWYGESDPFDPANPPGDNPELPIALRVEDIDSIEFTGANNSPGQFSSSDTPSQNPIVPEIIFSEACYGAHILGKTPQTSIALKFLKTGTQAFIGSTCTSYGAIMLPPSAADLLGRIFWIYLREGLPAGDALRRAKIYMANERIKEQGFLDSEDQKTLISFILYGDPLTPCITNGNHRDSGLKGRPNARAGASRITTKSVLRLKERPHSMPVAAEQILCDQPPEELGEKGGNAEQGMSVEIPIPDQVKRQVKHILEQYLPGMQDAQIQIGSERLLRTHQPSHTDANYDNKKPATHAIENNPGLPTTQRKIVTLYKTIQKQPFIHQQVARLTLDDKGKLVKLVVSR